MASPLNGIYHQHPAFDTTWMLLLKTVTHPWPDSHLNLKNWLSPEAVDAKKQRRSSGDGRLPTPSLSASLSGCLIRLQTSLNYCIVCMRPILNASNEASKNPKQSLDNHQIHTAFTPPNEQLSPPISQCIGKFSWLPSSPELLFPSKIR